MPKINPKVIEALAKSHNDPNSFSISVDGDNCKQVLQMLALRDLANQFSSDDHDKKHSRSSHSQRFLPAQ